MPPLRVLQILRAPVGGLFRHVVDLSLALGERGHKLGLIADSLATDELTNQKLEQLRPVMSLGIHRLPIPRVLGPGDFTSPFRIRQLASELDIQVLHGHGAKGGLNARLSRIASRRVSFYTPHGGVLNYLPGSLSSKAFLTAERLLRPATDTIIFESAFAKGAYERLIGPPGCPTPVVLNGLSPADFQPIPLPGKGGYDFVFVGELRPVKGIGVLLTALENVATSRGRKATLLLAGGGPDEAEIRQKIADLGMQDRVHMAGVVPARAAFAQGACVVIPSLAESLPYVVLEAAAGRRPIITTNVGGIREIFGPTADKLVPAGQAEPLRAAMQAFLDDPAEAIADMRTRFDFVRQHFSIDKMTNEIEALYRQALDRR
jgi:glycosyltransferase involved in cell wall biosynthesis